MYASIGVFGHMYAESEARSAGFFWSYMGRVQPCRSQFRSLCAGFPWLMHIFELHKSLKTRLYIIYVQKSFLIVVMYMRKRLYIKYSWLIYVHEEQLYMKYSWYRSCTWTTVVHQLFVIQVMHMKTWLYVNYRASGHVHEQRLYMNYSWFNSCT